MLKQIQLLKLIFLMLALSISSNSYSQWLFVSDKLAETSVYAAGGVTKLFGDMGGYALKTRVLEDHKSSFGIGMRQWLQSRIGFSVIAEVNNYFTGSDVDTHLDYRKASFQGREWGVRGQLEITLYGGTYMTQRDPHSLYVFGGPGYSMSQVISRVKPPDAMSRRDDKYQDKTNTLLFYGGFGYQYRLSNRWGMGLEYRYTQFLSDFVDGYHPEYSKASDSSQDLRFTLSYYFNLFTTEECDCDINY